MKFFNIFMSVVLLGALSLPAKEKVFISDEEQMVNINFKDLEIGDFIKLVSKLLNKNVLMNYDIRGKVEFISSTPVYKSNIQDILQSVLESKGYTLIDSGEFFQVVRSAEASQYNLPIVGDSGTDLQQMVTETIKIEKENVDIVASKIRHLITKSAKLITVKENNMILITDFPENIKTMKRIIRAIEDDVEKIPMFFELENTKVTSIYGELTKISKEIFNQRIENQKINFFPNKDANSLIVVAAPKYESKIRDLIEKFDIKTEDTEDVVKIISLKNSEAKDILAVLNAVVAKKKYSDPKDRPSLSADIQGNNIVAVGIGQEVADIEAILQELDREQQQVYVKAQIIEISTNKADELGVKYGLEGGKATTDGLFSFATNLGGSVIPLSSTILSYIDMDTIDSGLALGASINFLRSNGAADVISEPSILCMNNKESSIYVGQTQSFLTSSVADANENAQAKSTYKREDVGLTLKVKPRISSDGKVLMDVNALLEDALADRPGAGGNPTTTKREVATTALVRNGENVIIGGLIKNNVTESTTKLPLLGDIPVLGHVFRNTNTQEDKTNLVIILTPYVIDKSSNLSDLRTKLAELDDIQTRFNKRMKERLGETDEEETTTEESSPSNQKAVERLMGL